MSLTNKIIIFMFAGAFLGIALNSFGVSENELVSTYFTGGILKVIGGVFLNALKMMVVPLVFVSLFCGAAALKDPAHLGTLGGKTLALYLLTTAIALILALTFAHLINPGIGFQIPADFPKYVPKEAPSFVDVLINIVPSNPIAAMTEGNMLQIIVFSILLGVSATMAGKAGEQIISLFQNLNEVIMKLVHFVMILAPYAVFSLITIVFADLGTDAIANLSKYFFNVLFVLLLHAFVIYPLILTVFGKLNPISFLKKMRAAVVFAFGSASSSATIPVTLRTATKRMGVDKSIASFTIPFGATINMDGTAIMQGVATVFIAQAYGIPLSIEQLGTVVVMATMASIGTAGVPGVGLLMLAGVLSQVGLPVEAIGIILGVDRLLDMTRTAVNVTGDVAVTCIVAKQENKLDADTYNDPEAGNIED
jgi:Na+/H+-dicarboxylate symporter